jgi:hypothetical protein
MGWTYHNKPPMGWPIDFDHPLSNFLGFWPMFENSGGIVQDLSENGNDGTFVGIPTWTLAHFGSGLQGFTTADYVALPNGVFTLQEFTIIVWFKVAASGVNAPMFEVGNYEIDFHCDKDNYLEVYFADIANLNGSVSIRDGLWHQGVLTKIGSLVTLYVDGVYDNSGTSAGAITFGTDDAHIGTDGAGGFIGTIDHVIVYDHGKSASEVALLYREPWCMFKDPDEIPVLDQYYTEAVVGNAGIMTTNTGFWGPTF